jgi:hypothetical protein
MSVKTRKLVKKIAAIRANFQRYGGYEMKEYPHPERNDCYLFSITNPKSESLIFCELVYYKGGNWQLRKSQYSDQQAVLWLRGIIHQTLQGKLLSDDL